MIASLSVDSLMPAENFLSLANLTPSMAQDNIVKALSLLYPHLHTLSPWQLLLSLTKISTQHLLEKFTTKLIQYKAYTESLYIN